jgi:hypothetical protein
MYNNKQKIEIIFLVFWALTSLTQNDVLQFQKSYVLPHMWTLDQRQTQQGDWALIT